MTSKCFMEGSRTNPTRNQDSFFERTVLVLFSETNVSVGTIENAVRLLGARYSKPLSSRTDTWRPERSVSVFC